MGGWSLYRGTTHSRGMMMSGFECFPVKMVLWNHFSKTSIFAKSSSLFSFDMFLAKFLFEFEPLARDRSV